MLTLAARWKRNFTLFTAIIIPREIFFVNTFLKFFRIFLDFFKTPYGIRLFLTLCFQCDTFIWAKVTKITTTKGVKNLPTYFLHKKIGEKSYKMDIYKSAKMLYNKIPSKDRSASVFISCTTGGFLRNINLMISSPQRKPLVVLFFL